MRASASPSSEFPRHTLFVGCYSDCTPMSQTSTRKAQAGPKTAAPCCPDIPWVTPQLSLDCPVGGKEARPCFLQTVTGKLGKTKLICGQKAEDCLEQDLRRWLGAGPCPGWLAGLRSPLCTESEHHYIVVSATLLVSLRLSKCL